MGKHKSKVQAVLPSLHYGPYKQLEISMIQVML